MRREIRSSIITRTSNRSVVPPLPLPRSLDINFSLKPVPNGAAQLLRPHEQPPPPPCGGGSEQSEEKKGKKEIMYLGGHESSAVQRSAECDWQHCWIDFAVVGAVNVRWVQQRGVSGWETECSVGGGNRSIRSSRRESSKSMPTLPAERQR